ncbi:MAG: sigma-70 family RNA polymerase sigma factor [Myxococcota bacterium]|nr:sigma-70 family RNA polymerase sigma factor [Myxococcota bacterium]
MRESQEGREAREERWRAWMGAAQTGDQAAYEKLLVELLPHIRAFVRRRVFDASAQEDVLQNVLLSLHRARHTYRSERPFTPWLHAIARNAVTDHGRVRGRRLSQERSLEDEGVAEPVAAAEPETGEAFSPELEAALAGLPPKQREAVFLVQVEGLSVAEAAARAGVSVGALKVRAHRGYRLLRDRLGACPSEGRR